MSKRNTIIETVLKNGRLETANYAYILESTYTGEKYIRKHYLGGWKKEMYVTVQQMKEFEKNQEER